MLTVVFDLGGVLIDWDPRHLYRTLLPDEAAVNDFLATVCTLEWNVEQDRGRTLAEGTASLQALHPEHADLIAAYYGRWPEMLGGPIEGTVAIAEELKAAGAALYALSNWSAQTFPLARDHLRFLEGFDGVLISGEVGLVKPDPAVFELFEKRFDVDPTHAIYIDDSPANVEAAARRGYDAIHFTGPEALRSALADRGLPPSP